MSATKVILCLSDVNAYSRAHARVRALADLGHTVICVPSHEIATGDLDYVKKRLPARIVGRLAPSLFRERPATSLASLIAELRPDIFWADKPSILSAAATRVLRQRATRTKFVMFSEDDLWMPHNRSKALAESIPEYDVVFTTKSHNIINKELERLGAQRVAFVTQAFDPYQHYPQAVSAEDRVAYGATVGFIGNFESERATSIARLSEAGVKVRVWGNGWRGPCQANVRVEGAPLFNSTRGLFYSKGISATDINLGFLRHRNRDTHTSRTFEIPACGGFLLAEHSDEQASLFVPDVEAAFFSSDEELVEKVAYYFSHPDIRQKVAKAGLQRCLKDYTSVGQMRRALEIVDGL
jgi:spore maturation protein CgeB